jgi:hypothetical protein
MRDLPVNPQGHAIWHLLMALSVYWVSQAKSPPLCAAAVATAAAAAPSRLNLLMCAAAYGLGDAIHAFYPRCTAWLATKSGAGVVRAAASCCLAAPHTGQQ